MTLTLASRSPRRRELLARLVPQFDVLDVDVEEKPAPGEAPIDYVLRVATDKALAARRQLPGVQPILSADTEVILDEAILGKPADRDAAVAMLQSMSGREHLVVSGVVLLTDTIQTALSLSRYFRPLSVAECQRYCDLCRPYDKAGSYGVQDLGAGFIDRLDGSYTGVMGLPLTETAMLLQGAGLPVIALP